jgi:hypothetical protein
VKSPEFNKALNPDGDRFMAMPYKVMAGYENLIFGEAIPGLGGSNGVMFDKK